MTTSSILIVPGFKGSGPAHWQTWLQTQMPESTRIAGIDWDQPVLATWAERVRDELARASRPVHIIAHSFGCLAAVVAVADRPEQVADLILAAPADPDHFDFAGLKPSDLPLGSFSLAEALPRRALHVRGVVIASRNDRWLTFTRAVRLAIDWGLDVHDAGAAGHINADSGYGPWPDLLVLLEQRRKTTSVISAPVLKKRPRQYTCRSAPAHT